MNSKSMLLVSAALFALGGLGAAQSAEKPKYSAKIPPSIETPDEVHTAIGTLRFKDGAPDEHTVKLVYDQLDLSRGIEAFMQGMPATSIHAACRGFREIGMKENQGIPPA